MKDIIERNYDSTVRRGLITPKTQWKEFTSKIQEEVNEYIESADPEELADIILVCLNIAKHYQIDIEQELINKINKNYQR
jgi:predicted house-cleaning noncanonical NTP pyrophosphatase (MazG superfamily)